MINPHHAFEQRKKDHLIHAMKPENQAMEMNAFDSIRFLHEALPNGNFEDIDFSTVRFGQAGVNPFFVSSMTAGHDDAPKINATLMEACCQSGWMMGVGSQRRELEDDASIDQWKKLRQRFPQVGLMSNLGIAQVILATPAQLQKILDSIEASALIIHCNPLQECIQAEGTPQFKGAFRAIEALVSNLSVPVVVKETGCGFSQQTLRILTDAGVHAIDVSGLGGTHWGRIEGARAESKTLTSHAAQVFKNWGITTVESLQFAKAANLKSEVWASGGIRHGLDAAKAIALGASSVGFAKLMLESALLGVEAVYQTMLEIEYTLKIAMFCTGSFTLKALQEKPCL
jgi:isopentenyl-diphosphate delta-isomerase